MAPNRIKTATILGINNKEEAKNTFLADSFILGRWVNLWKLEEEGFLVPGLFDRVKWTAFLKHLSS